MCGVLGPLARHARMRHPSLWDSCARPSPCKENDKKTAIRRQRSFSLLVPVRPSLLAKSAGVGFCGRSLDTHACARVRLECPDPSAHPDRCKVTHNHQYAHSIVSLVLHLCAESAVKECSRKSWAARSYSTHPCLRMGAARTGCNLACAQPPSPEQPWAVMFA